MGKLYLIPTPICSQETDDFPLAFGPHVIKDIRIFMAEEERAARKFLKKACPGLPFNDCRFFLLSEHTSPPQAIQFLHENKKENIGILSEAGCPCIADPGSEVVLEAHRLGMEVLPLAGPSSIFLALMASGLNGQNFSFQGYLPKDKQERFKKVNTLEQASQRDGRTQIFMETPYHNQTLWAELLSVLAADTLLCIAIDLTGPSQSITTKTAREWKKLNPPPLHKRPALFLLQGSQSRKF